jgi:hypothetical protein
MVRYTLAATTIVVAAFIVMNVEVSGGSSINGMVETTSTTGAQVTTTTTTTFDLSWMNTTTTTTAKRVVVEAGGDRWDRLAQCETGGNWATNTGNGFGGGLQFMHQSAYSAWLSYGGSEFTTAPWEATREQQIVVAERILAGSGWRAWPGCSRKFGWL